MKITLALDTATNRTILAILNGDQLIWSKYHDGATEHTETLIKLITEAMKQVKNIDQVIVGMGPGPFTGLRAGIAFAESFAFARGLPIYGVCSLDAIAAPIKDSEFIVATDARRKELYWAHYKFGKRISGPNVSSPNELPMIKTYYEFPNLMYFPKLKETNEVKKPLYLRHPDAKPTSERI